MINNDEEIQWAYLLDPTFELVNSAGKPLTDGWLEVYIHGTRNKYYCASDFDGTLHPFKIPLDSLGANIVLASPAHSYDVYVYNRFGSLVMSRYNVVPATGDGSVIKDVVTITSNDGTVDVSASDQTNWDLSIKNTIDTVVEGLTELIAATGDDLQSQIDGKKDKQSPYSKSGSVTKTITAISQNENGEISVTYSDIDLPPEVPNVDLTSPCGTIDIQTDVDVESNTKTFKIDVKKSNMQYFDGYAGASHYEDRDPGSTFAFGCPMNNWSEYKYEGDFITNNWQAAGNMNFLLKPGIYLVTATIRYAMTSASAANTDGYIRIATGSYNGLENGTRYKDWSHEYQMGENTIQMAFVRTVLDGGDYSYIGGNDLYFYPYLPYGVNYAQLDHLQIVKLDSVVGQGGGSASNVVIARESNGVLDDTYDGVKIRRTDNDNEVVGLRKNNTWYSFGQLAPLSAGANKILITDANGTMHWVVVGEGLEIDDTTLEVKIDSDTSDVVKTVEKLEKDLDTQLTVNFDMPNVDNVYDFADTSVIGMSNGAVMLCQAFTVPINHEIRVDDGVETAPTLLGIYAKQAFTGKKIMLALYVYDFSTGYTDYVGDTGPVEVMQGRNEFPLKHINANQTELKSSCVYYASLYLPSNAHSNGLYLAACSSYSNASYINAIPRFTVGVQNITHNNQEIDMTDATTGRLDFNDGQGNYYIGPWSDNYNEMPSIPRFFMQIRNGEVEEPIVVEPFTDLDYQYIYRNESAVANDIFDVSNLGSADYPVVYQEVTPNADVDIVSWTVYDGNATDSNGFYKNVYSSSFDTLISSTGTISDTTESYGYSHTVTLASPLHLTAGTTYRFPVAVGAQDYYFALRTYDSSVTETKVLHLFGSGWNISNWVNYSRVNAGPAVALTLTDSNNNTWNI